MSALSQPKTTYAIPRLAIIDDAEFDQMLYARIINRTGLVGEVLSFLSAEDALEHFVTNQGASVDVILLDINMPGMSGFDFLERISEEGGRDFTDMVVVMLTTSLDPSDVSRAQTYDLVKDYINKPLEEAHLAHISELLLKLRAMGPDD